MPGMDGIAFLRELRTEGNDIPFILFTGHGNEEVAIEALNGGAAFYLQKGGKTEARFLELEHKVKEIVRRRGTEAQLKENEKRLKLAHKVGHIGYWEFIMDADGGHFWYSDEALQLLGLPSTKEGYVAQEEIFPCIPEMDRVQQALHDLCENGTPYNIEFEVVPDDGGQNRILRSVAERVGDADGRSPRVIGVIQDITDKKREENIARANEARYRALFENSHEAMLLTTNEGRILFANPAAASIWGFTGEELVEADMRGLFVLNKKYRRAFIELEKKRAIVSEMTSVRRDGLKFAAECTMTKFFDSEGDARISMLIKDITERKRFKDRLKRLNRELTAIKQCAQAVYKSRTEQELMNSICRTICDVAGYQLAWIGMLVNDDEQSVKPVAWSGRYDYVSQINASWGKNERGGGPTGLAARTCSSVFVQDLENDPRVEPWKDMLAYSNYRSVISIPIFDGGVPFATIQLYSDRTNGFNMNEIALLEEMAIDLGFGILALRDQKLKQEAEEALKRQSALYMDFNKIIMMTNRATAIPNLCVRLLEGSLHMINFDCGAVYLLDRSKGTATVAHSRDLPEEFLNEVMTIQIDREPYDSVFINNHPIFTEDYSITSPERSGRFGFKSIISIPLLSKGDALGALNLISKTRVSINDEERKVLRSIGRETGNTIDRMMAEAAAKEANKNLATVFDSIDDLVIILDMEGKVLDVNNTVLRRLSYAREEILGMDASMLYAPERRDEASEYIHAIFSGTIDSCSLPLLTKDGRSLPVEIKVTHGRWQNQEVIIELSRVITERDHMGIESGERVAQKRADNGTAMPHTS